MKARQKHAIGDTVRLIADVWTNKSVGTLWTVEGSFAELHPGVECEHDDALTIYSIANDGGSTLSWIKDDELEPVRKDNVLRRLAREFLRRLDANDYNPMRVR